MRVRFVPMAQRAQGARFFWSRRSGPDAAGLRAGDALVAAQREWQARQRKP